MEIIIATHSDLGLSLINGYEMIAGKISDSVSVFSLTNEKGIENFTDELISKLDGNISGKIPTLILCDILGGTPYNVSYGQVLKYPEFLRVISGVNLPMILEIGLGLNISNNLEEITQTALSVGLNSIAVGDYSQENSDNEDNDLF